MKNYKLSGSDVMHYSKHKKLVKGDYIYAFFCTLIITLSILGLA